MHLGEIIKEYRTKKGLSLRDLSKLADVSPATLSQIENNKTSPNLITLKRIAQVLDVSVISLLASEDRNNISFVKRKDRKRLIRNTTSQGDIIEEFLIENHKNEMEPAIISLPPYAVEDEPISHQGEEFIHVLNGIIEVELQGVSSYILEEGDTLYYPCSIPHSFKNLADIESRFIIVATPSNF